MKLTEDILKVKTIDENHNNCNHQMMGRGKGQPTWQIGVQKHDIVSVNERGEPVSNYK